MARSWTPKDSPSNMCQIMGHMGNSADVNRPKLKAIRHSEEGADITGFCTAYA